MDWEEGNPVLHSSVSECGTSESDLDCEVPDINWPIDSGREEKQIIFKLYCAPVYCKTQSPKPKPKCDFFSGDRVTKTAFRGFQSSKLRFPIGRFSVTFLLLQVRKTVVGNIHKGHQSVACRTHARRRTNGSPELELVIVRSLYTRLGIQLQGYKPYRRNDKISRELDLMTRNGGRRVKSPRAGPGAGLGPVQWDISRSRYSCSEF
ncbi:hypothetical protein BDN72DRAFT_861874 [Pluteus cervinus]|uniref:Uncharacterized protein n=1 Tax=Pluteus cervinus TaxID=181527 RepID=A0ACD3ADM8_9AGAR|nr:hypothetical protein BDN72DRAFT_861874 [Pluteus cervinus]